MKEGEKRGGERNKKLTSSTSGDQEKERKSKKMTIPGRRVHCVGTGRKQKAKKAAKVTRGVSGQPETEEKGGSRRETLEGVEQKEGGLVRKLWVRPPFLLEASQRGLRGLGHFGEMLYEPEKGAISSIADSPEWRPQFLLTFSKTRRTFSVYMCN